MLKSLFIKNFVLIVKHEIDFSKSLNVITGETGAGKSIIVNALKFLLGDKIDKSYIRNNETELKVQGDFDISKMSEVQKLLKENDIELDGNNLLIERTLTLEGKNNNRLNGEKVTLTVYKAIVKHLIVICGQHDNVSLLETSNHIKIIDSFCAIENSEFLNLKKEYSSLYRNYLDINKKLNEYSAINNIENEIKNIKDAIFEIEEINLKKDELQELQEQDHFFENYGDIEKLIINATGHLCDSEDEYGHITAERSIEDALGDIESLQSESAKFDELYNRLNSVLIEVRDINDTLNKMLNDFEYDVNKAEYVHDRLNMIYSMESKYKKEANEFIPYLDELKSKLNTYLNLDDDIQKLNEDKLEILEKIRNILLKIRQIRINVSENLSKQIINELKTLKMPSTQFVVEYNEFPDSSEIAKSLTLNGVDEVTFKISTNVGQDIKPLNKIASGGEMSRIMLAIKNVLYKVDNIQTIVFDEIDTGISGVTANALGDKLYLLSLNRQVILITHLAQIAALADKHLLINKSEKGNLTFSEITELNDDERILEISRLISGKSSSEISKKQALELIKRKAELNEL